jgi:hypothetical protein
MKKRKQVYWVIKHWRCGYYPLTLRELRKDAVAAFYENYRPKHEVTLLSRLSINRAVKVIISEAK